MVLHAWNSAAAAPHHPSIAADGCLLLLRVINAPSFVCTKLTLFTWRQSRATIYYWQPVDADLSSSACPASSMCHNTRQCINTVSKDTAPWAITASQCIVPRSHSDCHPAASICPPLDKLQQKRKEVAPQSTTAASRRPCAAAAAAALLLRWPLGCDDFHCLQRALPCACVWEHHRSSGLPAITVQQYIIWRQRQHAPK